MNSPNCHHADIRLRNCLSCGAYVHRELNVFGLKSDAYTHAGSLSRCVKSLRKSTKCFSRLEPTLAQKPAVKSVFGVLMSRLQVSRGTYALGLYLLEAMGQSATRDRLDEEEELTHLAAVSFVLACKLGECEPRVPSYQDVTNVLRRSLSSKSLKRLEYKFVGGSYCTTTFVDFLSAYLVKGGVFSSERVRRPEIFENRAMDLAWEYVKSGEFMRLDQEDLAAFVLYKARKEFRVAEIWNWHIESYTMIPKAASRRWSPRWPASRLRASCPRTATPATPSPACTPATTSATTPSTSRSLWRRSVRGTTSSSVTPAAPPCASSQSAAVPP